MKKKITYNPQKLSRQKRIYKEVKPSSSDSAKSSNSFTIKEENGYWIKVRK